MVVVADPGTCSSRTNSACSRRPCGTSWRTRSDRTCRRRTSGRSRRTRPSSTSSGSANSASLRRRLGIEAGDKLRWDVDGENNLSVEVVRQRYGAFDGDDLKAPLGGDGLETHDIAGREDDPAFSEDT